MKLDIEDLATPFQIDKSFHVTLQVYLSFTDRLCVSQYWSAVD